MDVTMTDRAMGTRTRPLVIVEAALLLLIAVGLALRLRMVFYSNINWDEFLYLSRVYEHLRGELNSPLQTFFVHFFTWLPNVSINEVDQLIAARGVQFVLSLGTAACIYLIARAFYDRAASLFVLLVYLSFTHIVDHAIAFRADPIGAFLFAASVCLLLRLPDRLWAAGLAGLLAALDLLITIKAVFHLATLGTMFLVLLAQAPRRAQVLRQILCFAAIFAVGGAALFGLHNLALADAAGPLAPVLGGVADKMFNTGVFVPRRHELMTSLGRNAVPWLLMLGGLLTIAHDAVRDRPGARRRALLFAAFLLPLLSILIYRNAYPYFYQFVLSPAVVITGGLGERLMRWAESRGDARGWLVAAAVIALIAGTMLSHYRVNGGDRNWQQRAMLSEIHRIFPEPVTYLDGSMSVPSFRKTGFFMSTWGIEGYLAAGEPWIARSIAADRPVFVWINNPMLAEAVGLYDYPPDWPKLIEQDRQAIADNYIPHWDMIFVAGKRLQLAPGEVREVDIVVPGIYTLESDRAVAIDGAMVAPGGTVTLAGGTHSIAAASGGAVTLRWGDTLFRPAVAAPDVSFYEGFL